MPKFRKKPVVIEAYQYTQKGDNYRPDWFQDAVSENKIITFTDHVLIQTLNGFIRAELNEWVVKGVQDEFYPCKPDIFEQTYEAVT